MLLTCWSAKGGSGATVTATALAVALRATQRAVRLVDLAGDAPDALGLADAAGPGVTDWIAAASAPGVTTLDALAVHAAPGLAVVPRGHAAVARDADRWAQLASGLAADDAVTVVDAGTGAPPPALVAAARHAWLVLRPCYLGLRAAVAQPSDVRPTGLVVVREFGRALTSADLAAALETPVVAELCVDPAVARAVDAGLAMTRMPRGLLAELRRAV